MQPWLGPALTVLVVFGASPTVFSIPLDLGPGAAQVVQELQEKFEAAEVSVDGLGRLSRMTFGLPSCWRTSLDRAYDTFVTEVWPLVAMAAGLSAEDTFDAQVEPWGPREHPLGYVVIL